MNYQKVVDDWFKENNWSYWQPLSILARLCEECGEFAREVNDVYGEKKKREDEGKKDIEMEMGDIIFTLACFANANGLSLDNAFDKALQKVKDRDKNRF